MQSCTSSPCRTATRPRRSLLRESYREDGKVRKRTLANLSCLPDEVIEGLKEKVLLRGGVAVPSVDAVFSVERTLTTAGWGLHACARANTA